MTEAFSTLWDTAQCYLKANFFCRSQRWDARQMPDQSGRVAIVTGGNTGIGLIACIELARRGAKVYMASRTESRAKTAIAKIKQEVPEADIEFLYFDLTILSSAKKAANEFLAKEDRLDILLNNAGIAATPYELSPDGIELQACNGTGHFALTTLLLPILKKTSRLDNTHVRIVNLSSLSHNQTRTPSFKSLEGLNKKWGSNGSRYGQSKLTNILLTNELQKRLQDTTIYCLSVHPGVVATELSRGIVKASPVIGPLVSALATNTWIFATPYAGAQTSLYAATSPEIEQKNLKAAYLVPYGQVGRKSLLAQDPDGKLAQQFWSLCEKLVADAENK